jgi:hypothetical protein
MTFFPSGNADTCLIQLENGQTLLFDYANMKNLNDDEDKRINLKEELIITLKKNDIKEIDMVVFTHIDRDHINGASDIFYLEHAEIYQDDDRIKIKKLCVPAAAITEVGTQEESKIIRAEARHRLKNGEGVFVFSRPEHLKDWLSENDVSLESISHLIVDAGQLVPGFTKGAQQLEIFVHSPFGFRQDESTVVDRNNDSIGVQLTFFSGDVETKALLLSDLNHELLSDIVNITKAYGNEDRLNWDILKLSHHCSYTSLAEEKGEEITNPCDEVKWLIEDCANEHPIIISTSDPIPSEYDSKQPPHRQAADYYRSVMDKENIDGEFNVTMEHPTVKSPKKLEIEITGSKATVVKKSDFGFTPILSKPAPRAG